MSILLPSINAHTFLPSDHPLNDKVAVHFQAIPGHYGYGTTEWREINKGFRLAPDAGTLTNMDPATDWVGKSHLGGFGALDFDGSNDYVDCGQDWLDSFGVGTISAWIYSRDNTGDPVFFSNVEHNDATGGNYCSLRLVSNEFGIQWNDGIATHDLVTAQKTISEDTWYHVAVVADGSVWRFYVNGQEITSLTTVLGSNNGEWFGSLPSATHDIDIGRILFDTSSTNMWDGKIDDFRIWGVPLSPSEIHELYQRSLNRYDGLFRRTTRIFVPLNTSPLTAITFDADGTNSGFVDSDTDSTYFDDCNDDPDSSSADYIGGETSHSPGVTSSEIWLRLADVDADFESMSTFRARVDVQASGFSNDTATLTMQIFDSDSGGSENALTDVQTIATEADTSRTVRDVAFAGITGTKTQWDGAYAKIIQSYDRTGSDDSAHLRLHGTEFSGSYVPVVAASSPPKYPFGKPFTGPFAGPVA